MEDTKKKPHSSTQRSHMGTVQAISGTKTIRVMVDSLAKHPQYGKYVKRSSQRMVHDPKEEAQTGDVVEIVACRPLSKNKSWRLVRVVRRPKQAQIPTTSKG